jgi:ATP-binding cassette subfamily B protein
LGVVGLVVGAAGCAVIIQYVMKLLVDGMSQSGDAAAVWSSLALFIGVIALESLLWRACGWLTCRTTIAVGVDMRLDLFEYLGGQPMRYFAENLAGSLGQRITSTAGHFGALTNTLVWRVLPPCVDFLGALVIFATVDWHMMIALGGGVLVIMTFLLVFGDRGRHLHASYAHASNSVGGQLIDVISNMWAVKAFSAHERERLRLAEGFEKESIVQRASWMYTERARLLHDVALWIMAGSMLTWAISLWSRHSITPGDVVVVSALTFRILHGSRDMALSVVDMVQHVGFIADTLKVIGQEQSVVDNPQANSFVGHGGDIAFAGVNFRYRDGTPTLQDIDLHIPAGQKLGIVGPSGAGKSTIVHLLQRLYDVHEGEIAIAGQSIRDVTQDSLRQILAVVPQEITLFHRSIADNIRFARPEATQEDIIEAAGAANCDGFIRNLPEGYDTIVGERGSKLSGGQRQRVGIARAFLKRAPILILDEATSALDTESELKIQTALTRLMEGRTVIAVAHRLSTVSAFDRIIVINDGRLVEDGAHESLIRRNGLYQAMWRRQAQSVAV